MEPVATQAKDPMMPQNPPTVSPSQYALTFLFLLALTGSLRAWVWAIGRLRRGQPLLEEGPPRDVPWKGLSVIAVIVLYLASQGAVVWAYSEARRVGLVRAPVGDAGKLPAADLLGIMLVSNALVVLLTPWLLRVTSGARAADFGVDRLGVVMRDLRRGFVGCLILAPVVYGFYAGVQALWPPREHPAVEAIRGQATGLVTLMVAVSAVVAAPLAEELVFRGVLLGWLTRVARAGRGSGTAGVLGSKPGVEEGRDEALPSCPTDRSSVWAAPGVPPESEPRPGDGSGSSGREAVAWTPNILVSLLFASVHSAQWPAPIPLFLLSLGLGWLYQRTGRLGGPVGMHATFNGFSTAVLLLSPTEPPPVPKPANAVGRAVLGKPVVGFPRQSGPSDLAYLTTKPGDLGSDGRTLGSAEDPRRRYPGGFRDMGEIGSAGNPTIGLARDGPWMRNARRSCVTCLPPSPGTGLPREGPRSATSSS